MTRVLADEINSDFPRLLMVFFFSSESKAVRSSSVPLVEVTRQ